MGRVFDYFGGMVAGLLSPVLLVAFICLAATVGVLAAKKTGRVWLGWAAGLLTAAPLFLALPSLWGALDLVKCKHVQNHEACVAGDDVGGGEWDGR